MSVAWYSERRRRLYAEIVACLEGRATEAVERRVTGDKESQAEVGVKVKGRGLRLGGVGEATGCGAVGWF